MEGRSSTAPSPVPLTSLSPQDIEKVSDYISGVASLLLGTSQSALSAFLATPTASEVLRRFIQDPHLTVIVVTREPKEATAASTTTTTSSNAPAAEDAQQEEEEPTFSVELEISFSDPKASSLAFIKRTLSFSVASPFPPQLQVLSLGNGTPFEVLHSYFHNAVSPYFNSYATKLGPAESEKDSGAAKGKAKGKGKENALGGVPMVKRKMAELELSLLQLQQNVVVPKVVLTIPPFVRELLLTGSKANVETVSDPDVLNKLQATFKTWVSEIEKITKLTRDSSTGGALQAINFWAGVEESLLDIDEQLKSDGFVLTRDILTKGKRTVAISSFDEKGFKDAKEEAAKHTALLSDFPIEELLSATDLEKLKEALKPIFNHLSKFKNSSIQFPAQEFLHFIEAINRDMVDRLTKILAGKRLMHLDYEEFTRTIQACDSLVQNWLGITREDGLSKMKSMIRDVVKRRNETLVVKIASEHQKLMDRLTNVAAFRTQHEQLLSTITRVTKQSTATATAAEAEDQAAAEASESTLDPVKEVIQAFEPMKSLDVLDTSAEAQEDWQASELAYNERVARVESHIITNLRDRLGKSKNANEMFRVFSQFNALFVRPKIKGAVQEYQTQLINNVKEDLRNLLSKYTSRYQGSEAATLSKVRDIPEISGMVIWARQIERQLDTYMSRVESVLGAGWMLYPDGQKLHSESNNLKQKLDTKPMVNEWLANVEKKSYSISGKIFSITSSRMLGGKLQLEVNFEEQIIALFKEVRNLAWLGFTIPPAITSVARDGKAVYPYVVSLTETIRIYTSTCQKVDAIDQQGGNSRGIGLLVAGSRAAVQQKLSQGMQMKWDSFVRGENTPASNYVRELASVVSVFQDRVADLIQIHHAVNTKVSALKDCPFDQKIFGGILGSIQEMVDKLNLESFTNLEAWAKALDSQIEGILSARLKTAITAWISQFLQTQDGEDVEPSTPLDLTSRARSSSKSNIDQSFQLPSLKILTYEIKLRNQVMYLDPPLEQARSEWITQLYLWLGIACDLPRIQGSRYDMIHREKEETTYRSLLTLLLDGGLQSAYKVIEEKIEQVGEYVNTWLRYQALWDLEPAAVYSRLNEDLDRWQQILTEIKKTRGTFDNSETSESFGPMVISYGSVQAKVNTKYDQWQKDVLSKFGVLAGQSMSEFYRALAKNRAELEQQSLDTDSTTDTVTFITFLEEVTRKLANWGSKMDNFKSSQKLLERNRYQFPNEWVYYDNIQGEWSAFNEILNRKSALVRERTADLQQRITNEDQAVRVKIDRLVEDWAKDKPVQGDTKPDIAMNRLTAFEGRLSKLQEDYQQLSRAKEVLNLGLATENRLEPVIDELKDLKGVWTELLKVWAAINEQRDTTWASVAPRKIRQSLDALMVDLKQLPANLHHYSAFDYVQSTIRQYLKNNSLVTDLKSDALRERHWRILFQRLRVEGRFILADMTLGKLWDLDLQKNEKEVRDVIIMAQGEMALEEYVKQVRECWQAYELELVNYQNKCRLIRGWDELFAKCGEHLNSLSAMKLSPYFKVFEEEALAWEEKLNKVNMLFDVWIDVQRQWVYLEGIFASSADIKHLLPVESARFQNINSEFLGVMKSVHKAPRVLDVLNLPGIQKSLDRLADLLSKIQKALGEYLERERASFPRFYFVGDEDLLEIIGNSKDIFKIQKHFKKMFAGLSNLLLNDEGMIIKGMASKEGEEIPFRRPISIKDHPKINDWLTLLEKEMRLTLADFLTEGIAELSALYQEASASALNLESYLSWVDRFPAQLVGIASQVIWTENVEKALSSQGTTLQKTLESLQGTLTILADTVLGELPPIKRKKCEHLITELVHQRDVVRALLKKQVSSTADFEWLYQMRFYFNPKGQEPLKRLTIKMANATFDYGYEYLGLAEKLVQTPLTDRCFLTLTQALELRLGGSPFGPAGTGKTESVKALGAQLGRFVLVFCCDETFDFQAMGRIFVGLCQVGAMGCFDEFNRLEERILSAVSQQVQTIQQALKEQQGSQKIEIELVEKRVTVQPETGIFITMNPGYAGRSNLPDNLKKLFRSMAMTKPDRELIAQVMLYSQGFRSAELLASKIVPFFNLCLEQLSVQPHYDFGLRALKSVLVSAGNLKRDKLLRLRESGSSALVESSESEQEILIQSVAETVVPKLVADDIPLLKSLLADVFPGVPYNPADMSKLRSEIIKVCNERGLEPAANWLEKVLQLYQIQNIHHGLMMVGPSGSGKSTAWNVLLQALERIEGVEGIPYVIDPKSLSKEDLYGTLDSTTREWTDGLFTHILRKIVDNVRGELTKRHWIIFDGDVDPEWVENLNSVLDDNKLLTLPNGERLSLPPCVRIMFEVQDLRSATQATVSRCGMVWFSEDVITFSMICQHYLNTLRTRSLDDAEDSLTKAPAATATQQEVPASPAKGRGPSASASAASAAAEEPISPMLQVQRDAAVLLEQYFKGEAPLVKKALDLAFGFEHIMEATRIRLLGTLFAMINKSIRNVADYNDKHPDFHMGQDHFERYMTKRLLYSVVWSFSGDAKLGFRAKLGEHLLLLASAELPHAGTPGRSIIDYDVNVTTGEWALWQQRVPVIEIETHRVDGADVVVPTVDTMRHEEVLYTWLAEHKPLILCGPPGSGKTMTLFSALRALPELEVVGLNFSSATTPDLILKTFDQYCEYRKTPQGMVLAPVVPSKWLVLFCDEINLPSEDKYGTQRVISFLRQMVEHGGFYRPSDKNWVRLERIQFVGACNPPTDPGRVPLSPRFLRHAPVVMVDYPGEDSLRQIYGTFNRALLKLVPGLRSYAEPLTEAMVDFYILSQNHFTTDMQAHYIYSPRELTRWVRGIYQAIKPLESLELDGLVRLWAHEALRLFQDRLVTREEREWTDEAVDRVALKFFPTASKEAALGRPILYSDWLSKNYIPVTQDQLREYIKARLKVFYEEELDVPLVLFDDVLEHVLRIDRVFKQVQGHLLLIGVSGAGKTTLSRFVAWLNGQTVFQIKVHNNYTMEDFDDDLRLVLRRAGCKGEKICFIMDESNILDSGFLERMNTLLANGEVPGLFDGDEHAALMTQCKEGSQRDGHMLDSADELYRWFTTQIMRNLHVVFTMNPPEGGLGGKAATSPALFNRCVLDWFGDWSPQAYFQVAQEFTSRLDLDVANYIPPQPFPICYEQLSDTPTHREAIVNAMVFVHRSLIEVNQRLAKRQGRINHATPRHYLDFIQHYVKLFNAKREDLEDQQLHLNGGLKKLRETFDKVEELQKSLAKKTNELERKNLEANEKLKQMVADQQEAEKRKAASEVIQRALGEQNEQIDKRKVVVLDDLSKAEPAVREAEQSVKSIKKNHLVELRAMANPPKLVKLALESVCVLLGESIEAWKNIQAVIRKDDFITSIVNYDTEKSMTAAMRQKIRTTFMSDPSFTFETVDHASKACGPLVQWVIAQVSFSEILHRVEPLKSEVRQLESQAHDTRLKAQEMEKMVNELEASIARYKEEYAILISETQFLKTEMEQVKSKVERATRLLSNLSSERGRWEGSSKTFEQQMGTIVGDVLTSAAFLAYAGFFDQQYRELLLARWNAHLGQAGIQFKQDLSLTEYLSTADSRLKWQANALPADDLCSENAIMLMRFNRYPLIIDPSGQATRFLMNEFQERKITKTSFLDKSFLKVLESALRFGNPLIVEDVENLDPILNPLLNKELRRTGGRVLVKLGSQDIDFSPSFTLFLTTRDPTVSFPPDLCSRVTFVNFTVTHASLQSQCLHQVLKAERPDTDKKRTDLLKLQGEFQVRLRHLEKSLLDVLSSTSSILENDAVITNLETLKTEAAEITRKMEETATVVAEVDAVTATYTPLAHACSSTYFVLERMNQLNHFYQYSLDFFYDIFDFVLHKNPALQAVSEQALRLTILSRDIFSVAFRRVSRGLLHEDYMTLALLLAQIKARGSPDQISDDEYELFLTGGEASSSTSAAAAAETEEVEASRAGGRSGVRSAPPLLDEEQRLRLREFAKIRALSGLVKHITEQPDLWRPFLEHPQCETVVPDFNGELAEDEAITAPQAFRQALIVKCLRPDRLLSASRLYVDKIFGASFMGYTDPALNKLVTDESHASTPIAFCAVPGYDASSRVESLAAEMKVKVSPVAIGSVEGFGLADKAISAASKSGGWVLLKNVHLAPQWLAQLEKKVHNLTSHPSFRLFMTMEINPKVPASILRMSRIVMFERPPGIKANLQEAFSNISDERVNAQPVERARIFFMLSWLHAVVQERLRYAPLGWTKAYEFNDSDLRSAMDVIDSWVDSVGKGRSNLSPDKIPWEALKALLSQSIYGGRIDNEFDQLLLETFISRLFSAAMYSPSFLLADTDDKFSLETDGDGGAERGVRFPTGSKFDQFRLWCEALPDRQPPTWLGLPKNAEKVLLVSQGNAMLSRVQNMRSIGEDDDASAEDPSAGSAQSSSLQPLWMRTLKTTVSGWLAILSATPELKRTEKSEEAVKDPLIRCLDREVETGIRLMRKVKRDLNDLVEVCEGRLKQTNHLRSLMNSINRGLIPKHWRAYKIPQVTLSQWVSDFNLRIVQLDTLSKVTTFSSTPVWIGGLFSAEAFITATRQSVAQKNNWSLEEISLSLEATTEPIQPLPGTFLLSGMRFEGATITPSSVVELAETTSTKLPALRLSWVRNEVLQKGQGQHSLLPVYLNSSRSELLFTVNLKSAVETRILYERGVALVASALKGV